MECTTRMVGLVLFLLGIPGNTCEVVYGLAGEEITLSPDATPIQRILWKYHDNKLAEWDTGDPAPEIYPAYKGRTSLNTTSGILTFTPLLGDNQTIYSVEINGAATSKQYNLHVLDAVAKPTVTCENINSSTVTLRCAGDQSPLTQYSWVGPGIQNKPGSELQLNNEDIQSSTVYSCVVKNPVSNRSEDFDAKTCLPTPGNSGIIAGVISFLIIALIGVVLCFVPPVRKRLQRLCAQRKPKVKEDNTSPEEGVPLTQNTGHNENFSKNGEGGTSDDKGASGDEEASTKQQEEETVNTSPDRSQPLRGPLPSSTLENGVTVDIHKEQPVQESGHYENISKNGEGGTSDDKGASGNEEASTKQQEETGDYENISKNGEGGTSDDKGASGNEEASTKQQEEETADSKDNDKNEESRDPDNVSPQHESNDETSFDQQDSEKENQAGNLEGEEHKNTQGAEAAETSESKDEGGNSEPSDLAEASAQPESDVTGKKDEPSNEEDHAGNRDTGPFDLEPYECTRM